MIDQNLKFEYTNHRGEKSIRTAIPRQIVWRATSHHPEAQWIMIAWDKDKQAVRDFALKDCDFTTTE